MGESWERRLVCRMGDSMKELPGWGQQRMERSCATWVWYPKCLKIGHLKKSSGPDTESYDFIIWIEFPKDSTFEVLCFNSFTQKEDNEVMSLKHLN